MNILEVKNLSKKYKDVEVIKDVSFSVRPGETLVLIGPSGSGKSTLLRCINNLEKVDGGNIIIDGNEMIKEYKNSKPVYNDKETLNKINLYTGMVFQDFNLFPHLTVRKNITKALTSVLKKDKEEANRICDSLLKKMDLSEKSEVYPYNLSGGQKQRASIARCLAINPKIIFMDEGRIIEEGCPEDVIKNPKEKRTREFLNAINDESAKQKEFYGNDVEISLREVEVQTKALSKNMTNRIVNFINSYNNGALKFDENNDVILSANFGAINEFDDYVRLEYSLRSNDMSFRDDYLKNLEKQVKENDIEIIWEQELKGFEPDYTSKLVCMTSKVYKELFGKEIEKVIVQGVVEGGFFKDRMENVEYICVGANTFDVHSPKERVSISSMERTWEFIRNIIEFEE